MAFNVTTADSDTTISTNLHKLLHKEALSGDGTLSFMQFMESVLYAPTLGYYSAGLNKFGEQGDFITAPEISPLFSRTLAHACLPLLNQHSSILEVGAGSGRMAVDLLLELEAQDCLPDKYFILELSSSLHDRQRELFKQQAEHLLTRVEWLDTLPKTKLNGIILANELLDALPIQRFVIKNGKPIELRVKVLANSLEWSYGKEILELANYLADLPHPLDEGYTSEWSPFMGGWINSITDTLSNGSVLLIDYGYQKNEYYHPQRRDGTLRCYHQHHAHSNPLKLLGEQDITAHVDFTALIKIIEQIEGSKIENFTTQANFLLENGILNLAEQQADELTLLKQSQQLQKLLMPSEMGENVKVLQLTVNN